MTYSTRAYSPDEQGRDPVSDIQPLLRELQGSLIDARWRAARALGERGEEAVEPLIRALYHDDPGVRLLAAWALGNTGSRRALPYLERMLEDEDPCAQLAVECALKKISRGAPRSCVMEPG